MGTGLAFGSAEVEYLRHAHRITGIRNLALPGCGRAGARDVKAAREAWFEAQPDLDPERPIFIDGEARARHRSERRAERPEHENAPARCRCRRGERLRMAVPHGHWRTTTFVAGLRIGGLHAPMLIDGAMNGEAFLAYVRRVLVPALRPGDVVIMDTLGLSQERRRPRQ